MLLTFFCSVQRKNFNIMVPECFPADALTFLTNLASFRRKKISFLNHPSFLFDNQKKALYSKLFFERMNLEKLKEFILYNPKPFLEEESRKIIQKALEVTAKTDLEKFKLLSTLMGLPDSMKKFSQSKYSKVQFYLKVVTSQCDEYTKVN